MIFKRDFFDKLSHPRITDPCNADAYRPAFAGLHDDLKNLGKQSFTVLFSDAVDIKGAECFPVPLLSRSVPYLQRCSRAASIYSRHNLHTNNHAFLFAGVCYHPPVSYFIRKV